jgi:uncharacterized protein
MHCTAKKFLTTLTLAMILLTAANAWGQDIKTRMQDRLPVIVDLKARGVIGENNQGYLDMLAGQTEKKEIVAAENADRRTIYDQIARQTGTSAEIVGQRRALQIAEKAPSGEWLQNSAGTWYQK